MLILKKTYSMILFIILLCTFIKARSQEDINPFDANFAMANNKNINQINTLINIIPLYYAKAKDMAELLNKNKKILFLNTVIPDSRTNQIIIDSDTNNLQKVINIIKKLDHPEKQILIEAKIIEMSESAFKEFGLSLKQSSEFTSNINSTQINPNAFINNNILNPNSGIGVIIKSLSQKFILDLEIQALQSEGKAKIISKPHLIVTAHHQAHIQQGQEIPYQTSSNLGATNIQFKKALLSLAVTPVITPNDEIILDLTINKDQIKADAISPNNIPLIDTREIKTQIRLKNNDTIILGGITETQEINSAKKVPILNKLPIIGKLFQNKQHSSTKNEVIIFVTPKIVKLNY